MQNNPLYMRLFYGINELMLRPLECYDAIETPYAKEKPVKPNPRHSQNTGLENQIKEN